MFGTQYLINYAFYYRHNQNTGKRIDYFITLFVLQCIAALKADCFILLCYLGFQALLVKYYLLVMIYP